MDSDGLSETEEEQLLASHRLSLTSKYTHRNTHLEELLARQSLSCDQKTLVVAGNPGGSQVLIGQLDIFSMILQKSHDCGHQGRLILTLS